MDPKKIYFHSLGTPSDIGLSAEVESFCHKFGYGFEFIIASPYHPTETPLPFIDISIRTYSGEKDILNFLDTHDE